MALRYYQEEAVQSIFDYFISGKTGNPVIAAPTGVGKSHIIAELIHRTFLSWPNQRFLMLTHVKELLVQDSNKLKAMWPTAPVGIYSAGLGEKTTMLPIIFGGIASVNSNPEQFGHIDIVIVDECFSEDTEIFTENGFVRFDCLQNEKVAQYNIHTKEIDFVLPIRKINKPIESKMMVAESDDLFSVMATENHEMLVTNTKGEWIKRKFKDIKRGFAYKMTTAGFAKGSEDSLNSFEKFLIMFQADGNAHNRNQNGSFIAAFSFSKQRKIDAFLKLMEEGNFNFNEVSGKCYHNENTKDRRRFMVYLPNNIDKNLNKYFNISNLSLNKCKEIIEYMNIWDGHVASKNCYLYTNGDKRNIDFYQCVSILSGYRTKITKIVDNRSENFNDMYRLFITKNTPEVSTQRFFTKEVEYESNVYCVEVPTGCIVVRRNGKVLVTGNCHMISTNESSMYRKVIEKLKIKNPYLKVIGLSATPFRMGQGMITDGGLFTDIAYSASSLQGFNRLVAEGYISPLIPKRTSLQLNVESVKIVNGDYKNNELQAAVDVDAITYAAIKEMIEYGYERHCGLVFASGIEHCEHVTSAIQSFGESATCVHSKMASKERDRRIAEFKQGVHKYIVSNGILTTGFDHPPIDIIGFLRPTLSVALWVQSLGRGTRPYSWLVEDQYIAGYNYVKENTLVLDFAGNTRRLGPINDPVLPRKKGQKTGDAPIRICDKCGVYNHASARFCCACGAVFEFRNKLFDEASTEELIKSDMPIVEIFDITRVIYHKHTKLGSPNMLQVTYYSGLRSFKKFVCIEHTGFSRTKALEWWTRCSEEAFPESVDKALAMAGNLKTPKRISVHTNKRYPEVLNYEY